jgi:acetoacetyl-CoA synthetase
MREGELLWTPPADRFAESHLTRYMRWLARERGHEFADYDSLWRWSVNDIEGFWESLWVYFEIISDAPYKSIVSGPEMEKSRWFEGSLVNYAEHALRYESTAAPGEVVFRHSTEIRPWAELTWQDLGESVRRLASNLRTLGIKPGDRIVSYMPNVPETAIAMLATAAVGAIWSAAAPEFGSRAVIERFGQIAPRLAFVADGYSFGGKRFDRRAEIAQIVAELPSLENVVWLDYAGFGAAPLARVKNHSFADLLAGPAIAASDFRYERVAFDHPLWVLYSSGTTGIPKAITHSHVGMIVEHLKVQHFHVDLSPSKRNFFYTTTGWMMWNWVLSSLLAGCSAVLYDGSPVFGGVDALWRIASEGGATIFGASPTLVLSMKAANVKPAQTFDLSKLDTVVVGGAPATPDVFAWFYTDVRPDLWVVSTSGGTELCSALVGAVPGLPVYAGEMQARQLGMDVHAWTDDREDLIDAVGELVVSKPFPSQPIFFWGDKDGSRYHESYFDTFPGVWRHGDLFKLNARGGCYIYGRSDSTLNRFGVRIGSAEIYRVLEKVPEIADSLVICCELPDGGFYMPLFIALKQGFAMDDALKSRIVKILREDASPRHVPDEIIEAPVIPYTLTGKKMEVPIRKLVMGIPAAKAASRDAMANPAALDWFISFADLPQTRARRADVAQARSA